MKGWHVHGKRGSWCQCLFVGGWANHPGPGALHVHYWKCTSTGTLAGQKQPAHLGMERISRVQVDEMGIWKATPRPRPMSRSWPRESLESPARKKPNVDDEQPATTAK